MKTKRIALLIALLIAFPMALFAADPAPYPITCESQDGTLPDNPKVYQANEKKFRVSYVDGGVPTVIGANIPFFYWATDVNASIITATYSIVSATTATGQVDFIFMPADINTNGSGWIYGIGIKTTNGNPLVHNHGAWQILADPYSTGATSTNFGFGTWNWSLWTHIGTIGGAGVVFAGDGSQLTGISAAATNAPSLTQWGLTNSWFFSWLTGLDLTNGNQNTYLSAIGASQSVDRVWLSATGSSVDVVRAYAQGLGLTNNAQTTALVSLSNGVNSVSNYAGSRTLHDVLFNGNDAGGHGIDYLDSIIFGVAAGTVYGKAYYNDGFIIADEGLNRAFEIKDGARRKLYGTAGNTGPYINFATGYIPYTNCEGFGTAATNNTGDFATPAQLNAATNVVLGKAHDMSQGTNWIDQGVVTIAGPTNIFAGLVYTYPTVGPSGTWRTNFAWGVGCTGLYSLAVGERNNAPVCTSVVGSAAFGTTATVCSNTFPLTAGQVVYLQSFSCITNFNPTNTFHMTYTVGSP